MLSYRLYFLGRDGRITRAVPFESSSDEDALKAIEAHADGRPMELWQRGRMVRTFAAVPVAAGAR